MTIFVGIDNGLKGAVVVIDDNQKVIRKWIMPIIKGDKSEFDIISINKIFDEIKLIDDNIFVFLEKAYVRPIQGIRAAFGTGFCYGMMQALLISKGLGYEVINPSLWTKKILEGLNTNDKKGSIMFCQRKWPEEDWRATERSINMSDGYTDAACISLYGYQKIHGNKNE